MFTRLFSPRPLVPALLLLGLGPLALVPLAAHAQTAQVSQKPVLTTLHRFDGPHGANPQTRLTPASDGNFYGVTEYGGLTSPDKQGYGSVFQMTPEGAFTTLFRFNGKNGAHPNSALVVGADGALYGTTQTTAGMPDYGTVYRITSQGHLTTIRAFKIGDGVNPNSLTLAPDGSFYGTASQGGTKGGGTIFHLTTSGAITRLHSFTDRVGSELGSPQYPLVFGTDGALYGTTTLGGVPNDGGFFRITTEGAYTQLHTFLAYEGQPTGGVTLAPNGFFYGFVNGDQSAPFAYRISTTGVFKALHQFGVEQNGAYPYGIPVLGADGNFYAVSLFGGTNDAGLVFSMTPAGQVTTLYKFHTHFDGGFPRGVVFGPNGDLYGTTTYTDNTSGLGTLFKLTLPVAN